MIDKLPDYDARRQILATDSLASVDGFRIMIQLTFQHLFGMKFCPKCPTCNHENSANPCQDLFGSNATAEGGIFGRVDAVYTSIEAQKSTGSLHAHSQVFVQCLHQHTNIYQIMEKIEKIQMLLWKSIYDKKNMFVDRCIQKMLMRSMPS